MAMYVRDKGVSITLQHCWSSMYGGWDEIDRNSQIFSCPANVTEAKKKRLIMWLCWAWSSWARPTGKGYTYVLTKRRNSKHQERSLTRFSSWYMPRRCRNGQCFALVVLSKTNRERGYLRSEDAKIQVGPGSKFVQNYDGYMPNKCENSQHFALVSLSKTNRVSGYLRPEDA